ncbi:hypothetical protein B0H17DRAFT_921246, partial [Mycena rosella]
MVPTEVESWDALTFFRDILPLEPRDVGAQFELWAVARDKGESFPRRFECSCSFFFQGLTGTDTLRSMRKEVTKYIADGLLDASRKKKIPMNYVSYRKVIVLGAGCILKGYPFEGEPVNPNSINDVESIWKLRNALKSGKCFWYRLSQREKELERLEYEHLIEEGEIQEHTRKTRSDKNKPRKKDDE